MSNIIQAIGLIVATFSVIYAVYNKFLTKNSIKQATAIPNGIFILNIGIVIIGLSLIINQASTKSTIGGIALAIAGVALAISATTWRKDVLNQVNNSRLKSEACKVDRKKKLTTYQLILMKKKLAKSLIRKFQPMSKN